MIPLRNKTNAIAPGGTFVNGDLKDNPGDGSGVPVNRELLDDQAQFFETLMGICEAFTTNPSSALFSILTWVFAFTPRNYTNPQIDNGNTVFQLISAFFVAIGARVQTFIASQSAVNAGTDAVNYVTSLTLTNFLKNTLTWTSVAYASGWGDTAGQAPFKFAINPLGEVLLRGFPGNGSVSAFPSVITTLPANFRPLVAVHKTVFLQDTTAGTSYVGFMKIDTNGDISVTTVTGFTNGDGLFVIGFDGSFPTT